MLIADSRQWMSKERFSSSPERGRPRVQSIHGWRRPCTRETYWNVNIQRHGSEVRGGQICHRVAGTHVNKAEGRLRTGLLGTHILPNENCSSGQLAQLANSAVEPAATRKGRWMESPHIAK